MQDSSTNKTEAETLTLWIRAWHLEEKLQWMLMMFFAIYFLGANLFVLLKT